MSPKSTEFCSVTRINLTGGSYEARSPIAAAQRMLNLYSEPQPPDSSEPAPVANYQTPGLTLIRTLPTGPVRGIHDTPFETYIVAGNTVYVSVITSTGGPVVMTAIAIGTITAGITTPVSMADNGTTMVIVDGFPGAGWKVDLATTIMSAIVDPNFYGADSVAYLDTYFLFNKIQVAGPTSIFYWSDSNATTFTALNFASKTGYVDTLRAVFVAKREVWLLGEFTTEIWFDSGDPTTAFARVDGAFIDHGVTGRHSVASIDNSVFWLSRDRQGAGIVLQGLDYNAKRISTFALEAALASYPMIADAVGWTYLLAGHVCYVLTFPTADKTWVYDLATQKWHEWCWLDPATGLEHRHRGNCSFVVANSNVEFPPILLAKSYTLVGDRTNGNVYYLDQANFADITTAGVNNPIKRQRAFPHIEGSDGERLFFRQFLANISVGTSSGFANLLTLDWSDDRGVTWSTPITASMGAAGEGLISVQFQRLGMARSRVFRLTWTAIADIALLGAWVDVSRSAS